MTNKTKKVNRKQRKNKTKIAKAKYILWSVYDINAGLFQFLVKKEEYLKRCFIHPIFIIIARIADKDVAERKAKREDFISL